MNRSAKQGEKSRVKRPKTAMQPTRLELSKISASSKYVLKWTKLIFFFFFEGKKGSFAFTNRNVVGVMCVCVCVCVCVCMCVYICMCIYIYIYIYRTIMSLSQWPYVILHLLVSLVSLLCSSFYFSAKFKHPQNDNNFWGSIITPVYIYVSIILPLYV